MEHSGNSSVGPANYLRKKRKPPSPVHSSCGEPVLLCYRLQGALSVPQESTCIILPTSIKVMTAPSATLEAKKKSSPQKCRLREPFCLHAADWVHLSAVGLRQSLSDLQKNRNRGNPWACGNIHPTNIKRGAYFWVCLFFFFNAK